MLWCRVASFAFPTHPALEGSKCSADGQCYQGECVSKRSLKFVAFRKEALSAIRDLMQISPSNRLVNSSLAVSPAKMVPRTVPKSSRMEKKRPNQNKAKAASLARTANVKKNNQKKGLKASEILSSSVLKTSDPKPLVNEIALKSLSNANKTDYKVKVTNESFANNSKVSPEMRSNDGKPVKQIEPITSELKPQPKIMGELKSFFRGLTSNSNGLLGMFKTRFG
jgi:hypothetical protein